ncbi:MAG: hypothetical protein HQ527_07810 [Cyanobacteria bacterium]|nr:hypothetical protein [Cyanobacteria bacterium bin.51]
MEGHQFSATGPAAGPKRRGRPNSAALQAAPKADAAQLASLPVRELRQLARAAGRRALARNGRRAQLLEVLA